MAITATPVAVGQKTAADWANRVVGDLNGLGITKAQSGVVAVTITAATSGTATVTFPTSFAAIPTIGVTAVSGSGAMIGSTLLVTAISATAFSVRVALAASATVTPSVHWIALD